LPHVCFELERFMQTKNLTESSDMSALPTIEELLSRMHIDDYSVEVRSNIYTEVRCELYTTHRIVPTLAEHALLHLHGLLQLDRMAGDSINIVDLTAIDLSSEVKKLKRKGKNNYQGWIGELIVDYVLNNLGRVCKVSEIA